MTARMNKQSLHAPNLHDFPIGQGHLYEVAPGGAILHRVADDRHLVAKFYCLRRPPSSYECSYAAAAHLDRPVDRSRLVGDRQPDKRVRTNPFEVLDSAVQCNRFV